MPYPRKVIMYISYSRQEVKRFIMIVTALISSFWVAIAIQKQNLEVTCDVASTIAEPGTTYFGVAEEHCDNIQEAEARMIKINPWPPSQIPVGAEIILP